jgi:hypothetical protein
MACLRDPIQFLLDGAQADVHAQHRGTEVLDGTPAAPVRLRDCSQPRAAPWSIACALLGRHLRGGPGATDRTPPLMHEIMRDLHGHRRELAYLVGRAGLGPCKPCMATRHRLGWRSRTAVGGNSI